jgi:DNA polymerase III epsilon subunit family exonuclease
MSLTRLALHEAPLAFLDVETTGLSPHMGDRLLEIAILRTVGLEKIDTFSSLINPKRPLNAGAMAVNGITPSMVADAPTFDQLLPEIQARLQDHIIVAHNVSFDLGFLEIEFRLIRQPFQVGPVLDTLQLARRQYHFGKNSLSNIALKLNIPTPNAHRAMGDVLTTFGVFRRFAGDLTRRQRPLVQDWIRMQGGPAWGPPPPAAGLEHDHPITLAMQQACPVRIRYQARNGRITQRVIDPVSCNGTVVIAFCHLRGSQRTFRLDRILEANLMVKND